MLNLVASLVKTGVHGRIFSLDKGKPLPGLVVVKGINYTVKAHQTYADYHRLLVPGQKYEGLMFFPHIQLKIRVIKFLSVCY
jgi:carboxypeptidase D